MARRVSADQDRLGDVVGGMAQQDHTGAQITSGLSQQSMTRSASGGGQPLRRLVARPDEPAPVDAESGGGGGGGGGPFSALRVQPMIDG